MCRVVIDSKNLDLPFCPIPKPGENISWYLDSRPVKGILIGNSTNGPIVETELGNRYSLGSYESLRLTNPKLRLSPNWNNLGQNSKILRPKEEEKIEFKKLLSQRIPPGPQYNELIVEIWSRGFEIFLVGGTVRDVIAGNATNDVDLVTSMPLFWATTLLESMYRKKPEISPENGFVRLGGKPKSGDPFIDLKMISNYDLGTINACFGNDLDIDTQHRDFACNSVYYDPINEALIDPTGNGIADAERKQLSIVCNPARRSPFNLGQISIRFYKFLSFGFSASEKTINQIKANFNPSIAAMMRNIRINYLRTQLLSKKPIKEHEIVLEKYKKAMIDFGASREWAMYFEPFEKEILENGR